MADLKHYGIKRRSGRYPWGSGEDGYQRDPGIRGRVKELKDKGMTEAEIAESLGMKTTQLRAEISLEKAEQRKADAALAMRLKEKGYSNVAIGERMGINESSVRNLLDPVMQERALITERTADMLKRQIDDKEYLDIGLGVEKNIGISRNRLNIAVAQLEKEGYKVQYIHTPQPGGKKTSIKVLTKGDVEYKDLYANRDKIRTITEWTEDGGHTYYHIEKPKSISSKRIQVAYAEDGGKDKDGLIELRRGVDDISLGDAKYAQVRIAVDDTHFIKGMAAYSDDLPDGVDIRFNTNKPKGTPMMGKKDNTVLKVLKDDEKEVNEFGTIVRQRKYRDKDGNLKLSALNIVNEEGDWAEWSDTLSSQMLSKQNPALAKRQLDLDITIRQQEFDDYAALTNPTVKKQLLQSFADSCDAAAVDLKAAAMPRQANHVLIPMPFLKEDEVYAPNYNNAESVVLIRHPHGGIFEIPRLRVNNKDPRAGSILGNAMDAIGIHPKVAQKLSGADFDGDTVLVIPDNSGTISISPSLKSLMNFDPKIEYAGYPGMKRMSEGHKQNEMGKISNLITDMTIKGASQDEIARAVKHSMVVIDAEKHGLDYKRSYRENGIKELKETYLGGPRKGASTLISRASGEIRVPLRKDYYKIDEKTGKKIFIPKAEESYVNKDGKLVIKTTKSTQMYEVDDAYELSSGTRMESIYADYANRLKAMGDQARLMVVNTPDLKYSPSAKKTYQKQVDSLKAKLDLALANKPRERQALLLANSILRAKKEANPDLSKKDIKKIKGQALNEARARVGASKPKIPITPIEWEAIQAGAISNSFLTRILNNTDLDLIKEYATPRQKKTVSTAKLSKARLMFDRGYTQAEVARMLGLPVTTLMDAINEKEGD